MGKDSSDGIANELVGAGLVDNKDSSVITQNLQKLIESRETLKVVTFPLVSLYNLIVPVSSIFLEVGSGTLVSCTSCGGASLSLFLT